MAFKRNKKKPKMYRKKYSLNDRLEYHSSITHSFFAKYKDNNGNLKVPITEVGKAMKKSKKYQYSSGFIQGAERGKTGNFEECPKANQAGQLAGIKARENAAKLKF